MATRSSCIVLLCSLLFSSTLAANIVRRDLQHPLEEVQAADLHEAAKPPQEEAIRDPLKLPVAGPDVLNLPIGDLPAGLKPVEDVPDDKFMGNLMMWQTCAVAVSLIIGIVVLLYWRKGPIVILKVLIYLLALSSMKGAVKMVEDGNSFKFPLFLTGTHFASGATIGFVLLLRDSMSTGEQLAKPSIQDFKNRFGPIAVAFAGSVSMNNMALIHSTTAFVEIVGASAPIVTVFMTIVMKQYFDLKLLAPCFVVFIGCALTSHGEPHFSTLGLVLGAGSNLPRAFKTVLQQLLLQQGCADTAYSPIEVLAWTCLPSSILMLVWSLFQEGTEPYRQWHNQGFASQLTAALLLSAVNACILNTAILFVVKDLGAVGTQLVAQTKSILVVFGGMFFLKEQVSRSEFLGFALVMIGVYTYNDLESRLKTKREAEKLALAEKMAVVETVK